jgi:hypothetical protein
MATTTTNYGWAIPQSTDLVKDGATAIATLGSAIDTSINTALGTKKAGMVLLNTTSFSGVTSVSLPANTFTATYRNYRIIFRATQNTSTGDLTVRLRAAGVDLATGYTNGGIMTGISNNNTRIGSFGNTSWSIVQCSAGNIFGMTTDLLGPQVTNQTLGFYNAFSTSAGDLKTIGIQVGDSNSYDSLSFITSAGTITGTVETYGYNV